MNAPFEPLDDRPRWETIYETLRRASVNTLITYTDLAVALDLDPDKDRHIVQMAMRKASRQLLLRDSRAVVNVPNQGYRIAESVEQADLARGQQRRAETQLVKGHDLATYVDIRGMDVEQRRVFEMMAMALGMQMEIMRRLDVRQRRLEEAVDAVTRRVETAETRTDEQVRELQERLERLERRLP